MSQKEIHEEGRGATLQDRGLLLPLMNPERSHRDHYRDTHCCRPEVLYWRKGQRKKSHERKKEGPAEKT